MEFVEVVLGQLHLGAVQHGEAHADEDVLQLVQGQVPWGAFAPASPAAGDGHPAPRPSGAAPGPGPPVSAAAVFDGRLQGGADLVGQLAHGGALLGGQLTHHFQNGGELALLAQILDAQAVQFGGGRACSKAASASKRDLC